MELKVFKDTVAAYGGRWETRLELPVETELLIPDYLPAVFKIVKCLVEPVLLQNHTAAAKWQGEGYLRCTVYYQITYTFENTDMVEDGVAFVHLRDETVAEDGSCSCGCGSPETKRCYWN